VKAGVRIQGNKEIIKLPKIPSLLLFLNIHIGCMTRHYYFMVFTVTTCLLNIAVFYSTGPFLFENNPPEVRIRTPKDGASFAWNTLTRYAIEVSDVEDGASKYEEIALHRVFLEVTFLPEGRQRLSKSQKADPPGLALIKDSDCFNCHASKATMTGPSLFEIAGQYKNDPNVKTTMARRIIEGSSGVWGNVVMPPHPALNEREATRIAAWILENGGDPHRSIYRGLGGAFRTRLQPESGEGGWYRLTASYTDNGLEGRPESRKQGRHTIFLRGR
jgi:cytochrome c